VAFLVAVSWFADPARKWRHLPIQIAIGIPRAHSHFPCRPQNADQSLGLLMIDGLLLGFQVAFSLDNLLYCLIGVTLGTFIGMLPGVGPLVTIAMLLPMTYGLPPEGSLIMLAGIYYGASYGGSSTAILVNLPGEILFRRHLPRRLSDGEEGPRPAPLWRSRPSALSWPACIGTLAIAMFAPWLGRAALDFGAAEYTALIVMALVATSVLVQGAFVKGLLMALLGILIGLIGMDTNSGALRYTFGLTPLMDGVKFVVVAVGMFAFTEIITQLRSYSAQSVEATKVDSLMPTRDELRDLGAADPARHWHRHVLRHPARHRADDELFRLLSAGEAGGARSVAFRPRRHRRRGRAGGGQQCRGADILHPDPDAGRAGQRDHGADARRLDDPGHHARPPMSSPNARPCSGDSSPACGSAMCCW
jgi:large-conductance mechanosensitive channel